MISLFVLFARKFSHYLERISLSFPICARTFFLSRRIAIARIFAFSCQWMSLSCPSMGFFMLPIDCLLETESEMLFMHYFTSGKRNLHPKRFSLSSPRSRQRLLFSRLLLPFLLCMLLFSGIVNTGTLIISQAHAASRPLVPARATTTLGKFLAQKAPSLQPFVYPKEPPLSRWAKELQKNTAKILPSSEPVHMLPLLQTFSPTFLTSSTTATANPIQVHGSDGRLTVSIPVGAIDASQATLTNQATSANTRQLASSIQAQGLHLTITQISGISTGNLDSLGFYRFQFSDAQGHILTGIRLRHPVTIQFHYARQDLVGLGIDPGKLLLTWPEQIHQAIAAKQSTNELSIPMSNNATTQTLTAQTLVM